MKSFIFKKLLVILLIFTTVFPSNVKSQNCNNCSGVEITKDEFDSYKKNYRDIFIHGDANRKKTHPEWFFLPKAYINFFSNYLKLVNTADGLWIFFTNNGFIIDNNQQKDEKQIMINISGSENCSPEYDNFKTCVNASAEIKINNKIHFSTRKKESSTSIINYTHIMGKLSSKILENSFRYVESYSAPEYSLRMHLGRKHIDQLKAAIDGDPVKWQGVKFYFGVYGKIIDCTHMQDPNQFTLIAVPVKDQNGEGDIKAYNSFLKTNLKLTSDIYNHGSLCPNICQ